MMLYGIKTTTWYLNNLMTVRGLQIMGHKVGPSSVIHVLKICFLLYNFNSHSDPVITENNNNEVTIEYIDMTAWIVLYDIGTNKYFELRDYQIRLIVS